MDTTWDEPYFADGWEDEYHYTYFLKGSRTFAADHKPNDGFIESLGDPDTVSAKDFDPSVLPMIGNVNGDTKVDYIDLTLLARYLAGWKGSAYEIDRKAADISGDGYVTAIDRMILARYLKEYAAVAK